MFGLTRGGDDGRSDRLLLTGVVIAAGWSALISFVLSISPADRLPGMLFWLMGDLGDATRPAVPLVMLAIALPLTLLRARDLNIAVQGLLQAAALGVDTSRLRLELYFVGALLTAAAVTVAGTVGFVGLIVPHLIRRLGGTDHRAPAARRRPARRQPAGARRQRGAHPDQPDAAAGRRVDGAAGCPGFPVPAARQGQGVSCLLRTRALSLQIADTQVCSDMQLCIEPGQSWALLGRNGIGKTTLLHHLAGLRANAGGQVFLGANDISGLQPRERARQVAVLLQHSNRGFGASVLETVLSGRHPHLERLAWEDSDDLAIAEGCIAACGLATLSSRSLDTLSGGELRRVEIARLLTQQCPLALLDEPLNHLDFGHQAAMLRLLGEHCVSAEHAMLMVIHDLNAAYRACNHWLILSGAGRWHAGPRDALADPALLTAAFGHPVRRIETDDGPLFQPHL